VAGKITQVVETQFKSAGAQKIVKDTESIGRAQTRLGQASASAGRQFAAQANGLGGLVQAYAGAAATIFALQAAFTALNQAAQTQQVVAGLNALATTVGTTGNTILAESQKITKGLVSIRETAESVNIGLSAGFNQEQILGLQKVALGASRALGRTLTDALTRVTRGAAKLEPELLDELGIFVKIDPAVEAYAARLNKTASSLTDFERRQAFVNAVLTQGTQKFSIIDTSSANALESLQRLATTIIDLGTKFGIALAEGIAPFADYISKDLGNSLALFGVLARTVFGSALSVAIGGITKATTAVEGFANALGEKFVVSAEKQGVAFGKLAIETDNLDLRTIRGSRSQQKYAKDLINSARAGTLAVQDLVRLEKVLRRQEKAFQDAGQDAKKYTAALTEVKNAQAATGKTGLLLSRSLSLVGKTVGIVGRGFLGALRGVTSFVTAISVARLVLKPLTDALGVTDEIDSFAAGLFDITLRLFGLDDAAREAKVGIEGISQSLLASIGILQDLPDQLSIVEKKFFGLANIEKDVDKAGLGTIFGNLIKNLAKEGPEAIDDFRQKFQGSTFEAQVALDALAEKAQLFFDTFGGKGDAVSRSIGAVARQTGVAAKNITDFVFAQQALTGDAFQGVSQGIGGVTQFNVLLEESGQIIKLQIADRTKINDLIKNGRDSEAASFKIQSGILGLLTQQAEFTALITKGVLTGEQIKKREQALDTIRIRLLKEAQKLGSQILIDTIQLADANVDSAKAQAEVQTQQDLLNKRIRKDFSAQIAAADKLTGIANLNLDLAKTDGQIKANQLDQLTKIIQNENQSTKSNELRNTVRKVALGLVQAQLVAVEKLRKEEEKRLINLARQVEIAKETAKLTRAQDDLKTLQEENKLIESQLDLAERLRKSEQDLRQQQGQLRLNELKDELQLRSDILDKNSKLYSDRQLEALKIELNATSLEALKTETNRLIQERKIDLQKELDNLRIKADNDEKVLLQQKVVAEQQAALELKKVEQDRKKFDLEQDLRLQRLNELKLQENIFKNFIGDFAKAIAQLTADIKIATDPGLQRLIRVGADPDELRATEVSNAIARLTPQISSGIDTSAAESSLRASGNAYDELERLTIVKLTRTERLQEESADRQIEALRARLTLEEAIKNNVAQKDIIALQERVNETERAVAAQLELNRALNVYEVLGQETASSLRNNVTSAFMTLNDALIDGSITMGMVGQTFKDMIGNMLREIQQAVFRKTIVDPLTDVLTGSIGGLFKGGSGFTPGTFPSTGVSLPASGGLMHLAQGGNPSAAVMKRDRIPALLEPGEFVMRKDAVKQFGVNTMMKMNAAPRRGFAGGGRVGSGGSPAIDKRAQQYMSGGFMTPAEAYAQAARDFGAEGLPSMRGTPSMTTPSVSGSQALGAIRGMLGQATPAPVGRSSLGGVPVPGMAVPTSKPQRSISDQFRDTMQGIQKGLGDMMTIDIPDLLSFDYGASYGIKQQNGISLVGGKKQPSFYEKSMNFVKSLLDRNLGSPSLSKRFNQEVRKQPTTGLFKRSSFGAGPARNAFSGARGRQVSTVAPGSTLPTALDLYDPRGPLAQSLGATGSRGIPISIIAAALGFENVPALFAKAPTPATPTQLASRAVVKQRTGTTVTGYKGSQLGDVTTQGNLMTQTAEGVVSGVDPFALDKLGLGSAGLGGGMGFRATGSGAEFAGLGDFITAVTTPGRQSALTVAEYNAMSAAGRQGYAPGLGGDMALSPTQSAQLSLSGAYYTPGRGLTIPTGSTFSGSLSRALSDTGYYGGGDSGSVAGGSMGSVSAAGSDAFDAMMSDDFQGFAEEASGGLIRKMAAGGAVLSRDRVPALLEPGEFVIRRPMAKAIGGAALNQMNATGKGMKAPDVQVNLSNEGAPKNVQAAAPRISGDKIIIDMITRDMRNNGPIKKSLRK